MNRIFGGKGAKAPPPPTLQEATEKAEHRIETLDKKIAQLDGELRTQREQMKRVRPGPAQNSIKQRAMRTLKQKKMYEQQRDQLMNQTFNMEQASFTTSMLTDTVTTVNAMKMASKTIKQQFKQINIDGIDDLYDDMAEMMEENNLIQETLGRCYSTPDDLDENELEAELDALGDELLMGEDEETIPSYLLESAPKTELPQHETAPAVEQEEEVKVV